MAEASYTAQYRDWQGQWCDDGGIVVSSAREAYDRCCEFLTDNGYSGVQVRVLRHVSTTTTTVVPADEFLPALLVERENRHEA